jgi:hypothetical protein
MRPAHLFPIFLALALLGLWSAACARDQVPALGEAVTLTEFTENKVSVQIELARGASGGFQLRGVFIPPAGFHLYSKDIPRGGVDGLGRPTLLELSAESKLQALGELTESAPVEPPAFEPFALLVYPAGEVRLSLEIALPPGDSGWTDESVSVTYMACQGQVCLPPVMGKVVAIRVPVQGAVK